MQNEIENEVALVVQERPSLAVIKSNEDAQMVAGYLTRVKEVRKKIADFFRGDIDKAHELHKSLLAKMKQVEAKPIEVEAACKNLLTAWQVAEQARIRKAQEEADRKAQEEANRTARLQAIEAARLAAAEAKAAGDKKAAELARKEAEAIKAGTVQIVAAPVASVAVESATKLEGASLRETWSAEVTDLAALCKAVGAGKVGTEYVEANMTALNGVARATKGGVMIPGVKMVKKYATASR